ncbi:MAG: pseudouridine synthase [Acinetobacter sp.]|nr:pseudouridine synthase [Acinetobacter sp.]
MKLDKLLQSQGFGSRKHCQKLIVQGHVHVNGELCVNPNHDVATSVLADTQFQVFGELFQYRERVYIALNKPAAYECSHQPQYHHSVFDLLPDVLCQRGVQCVGRLDQDTTGLLLLTDDGQFLQRLTHPRQHIGKTYVVQTLDDIDDDALQQLSEGVQLRNEQGTFAASDVQRMNERQFAMTIHQGIYHQVKRMVASVGHKVVQLHRRQIGHLVLDDLALSPSEWCYLGDEQYQAYMRKA